MRAGAPKKGVNALYASRTTTPPQDAATHHPPPPGVNIIPCEATLESYIRGASFDAILDANRKVDRALAAGALALGAKVSVSDRPGYAPLVNSPELVEAVGEAMRALLGADRVKITNDWTTGCTDMGDVSCIMPVLHPHIAGAAGKSHGDDYHLVDREMACVNSAKGPAAAHGAAAGKRRGARKSRSWSAITRPMRARRRILPRWTPSCATGN